MLTSVARSGVETTKPSLLVTLIVSTTAKAGTTATSPLCSWAITRVAKSVLASALAAS